MKKQLLKAGLVMLMLTAFITTTNAFTAVTSGNWSNAATWGGLAPGGTVINQDIIIPAGITVTLDMDVTFTGLISTFTVDGSLTGGTNSLVIDQGPLAGSGTVDIAMLTFNTLGTMSFTGTLTVNELTNAGATLLMAATVSISDTLDLDAGSILLNTGANLTPMASSTIRVDAGTISISGGVFNSGTNYNVLYEGTSKTTGIEVNTTSLEHFTVMLNDNTQVLTLGSNLTVNGNYNQASGIVDISGRTLTLRGDIMAASGTTITSSATSNLIVVGTTSPTDALSFGASAVINNLTIDVTGGSTVKILTALNVSGMLSLVNGTLMLETGSTLTMNAGSSIEVTNGMLDVGTGAFVAVASYNLSYVGGSIIAGPEIMGAGLNNLSISLMAPTDVLTLDANVMVGGTFSLNTGKLAMAGVDVTLNGTFNQNSGTWIMGDVNSDLTLNLSSAVNDTLYFDATDNMLDNMSLNIAGGGAIVLGSPLKIITSLNLTNGKIDLNNSNLMIQSTGTITGYTDTKYIMTTGTGKLWMRVNTAAPYVTFPIGTENNYSPAYVQQTALGTSGDFMIGAVNDVYANGSTGASLATSYSLVTRTWFIDAAPGVIVNMNLKLGWKTAAEVNGFDRTDAYISHYTTMWDVTTMGPAAAGPNSTYELTRTGLTNLATSAFAVLDTTVISGIAEMDEDNIALYPNPAAEALFIETLDGTDYLIEVVDISGKAVISSQNQGGKSRLDVSSLKSGYYFIKMTEQTTKQITVKKFVKS